MQTHTRKPRAWKAKARTRYENGEACQSIGDSLGVAAETVMTEASKHGWQRLRYHCHKCGTEMPPNSPRNNAVKRTCKPCKAQTRAEYRASFTAEEWTEKRREQRIRDAKERGKTCLTREQRTERQRKAGRNYRRAKSAPLQLYHHKLTGEAPSTREGALLVLRTVMVALLEKRCEAEGLRRDSVEYRAKYATDPTFRKKERLRTSGKRWTNRAEGRDDGTLTPEVVRMLFARAKTCPYCMESMRSADKSLDHMDPLSLGGEHTRSNVLVCCRRCNSRKHATPFTEWLTKIPAMCARRFQDRAA